MSHPRTISIAEFDYPLPENRIASYPAEERDHSRLLIFRNGDINEELFWKITEYLPAGSLIVFNNTRVVEARLLFKKPTGATIEIFCLEPDSRHGDIAIAFGKQGSVIWKCLVGNASTWPQGLVLEKRISADHSLKAEMISRESDHFLIKLSWIPEELSFAELLHEAGLVPLPPYIKRKVEPEDTERYQTIYAHFPGSVAAPTAGLHFTGKVLEELEQHDIQQDFVTLHVGAGTFKPVKSETMHDHEMHAEFIEIKKSLVENLLANQGKPITAVGTTSLRALESLFWIGIKLIKNSNLSAEELFVNQWEPYERTAHSDNDVEIALKALVDRMERSQTDRMVVKTSLLIAPSYSFKIVNILVTNFHQPRSTLLLLVAAFIGKEWKNVYTYALENNFRFLSYGDSCLLFRK